MTPQRVALSYALAVGTACPLAYGLGKVGDIFCSARRVYYIADAGVVGTEVAWTAVVFVHYTQALCLQGITTVDGVLLLQHCSVFVFVLFCVCYVRECVYLVGVVGLRYRNTRSTCAQPREHLCLEQCGRPNVDARTLALPYAVSLPPVRTTNLHFRRFRGLPRR